jgi:hypothetical protein
MAIGFSAIAAGLVAAVLKAADSFTWPLFVLLSAGVLLLSAGVIWGAWAAGRDLRFVPLMEHGEARFRHRGDQHWFRDYHVRWFVTNLSPDRSTALLRARLPALRLESRPSPYSVSADPDWDSDPFLTTGEIAPGATEVVSFSFSVEVDETAEAEPLTSRVVVVDRFGRKYRTPRTHFVPKVS